MAGRKVGCGLERWHQFRLLTKKNFLLLIRNRTSTIVQVLVPILFILMLFLLDLAQKDNDKYDPNKGKFKVSESLALNSLPRCKLGAGKDRCYMVGYTQSSDPVVSAVINTLMAQNGLTPDDMLAFTTESESDNWLQANPNMTQGVYQFAVDYGCDSISTEQAIVDACYAAPHSASQVRGLKYVVQYNQTNIYNNYDRINTYTGIYMPYVNAIERAIFSTLGSGLDYDFSISKMAHPALPRFNIIALVGPSVIFAAIMFNMVIQTGLIVAEKELKLRESMRVMGLIDGVYWFSWIVLNVTMNVIAAFLLIAAGQAFRMPLFVKNDFGTYAVLLILFSLSMVPMGLLLSVFVDQASTATTAGFAVFLVGSLIQSFAGILYLESSGKAAATFFSLFPFVVFGKGLADLASATTNEYQTGMRWKDRFDGWWPMQRTYYFLIIDFFLFMFIALYLDNIMYSKRPWYFPISPTYWRGVEGKRSKPKDGSSSAKKKALKKKARNTEYEVEDMDEDVIAEEMMVSSGDIPASKAVVLDRLSMTYSTNRYLCCGNVSFRAVKDVCVTMDDGQLFCLLGHNGAGKSTTIGMLTGLLKPTSGDATILGYSITDSMDKIRANMGVCPQHDVLWPQLTAREHLELYAGFKCLYGDDMERDVAERLEDVALTAAADTPCGNYSGGMKRRLSVSIALIGDPKIVFLDEPTTGMDPVSRRQVWNLIERVKRGRVTLLTTHSMEEADVLGDRISIMKGGRFASLGSSLHLKRKYGTGYSVSVISDPNKQEELHDHVLGFFEDKSPDASASSGSDVHEMDSPSRSSSSPNKASTAPTHLKSDTTTNETSSTGKLPRKGAAEVEILNGTSKPTPVSASDDHPAGSTPSHGEHDITTVSRTLQEGPVSQYQVPLSYHEYLSDFFRSLESAKKKFGISNVQLAMTTLEDVFLRVAEQGEMLEKKTLSREQKAKRRRARNWKIFWALWIIILIVGAIVAVAVAFSSKKPKDPPTQLRSAEPPTFVPTSGTLDRFTFPSALQMTDVTAYSAHVSAYVTAGLTLTLNLVEGSTDSWTSVPVSGLARNAASFQVNTLERAQDALFGLKPDTVYNIWIQAGNGSRSDVTRFRTMPDVGYELRNTTIGATSSFGASGYPYRSLSCAAAYKLDAFLLLGDNVFNQESDTTEIRVSAYNRLLSSEGFSALTQSTNFIATWNDQEVYQGWRQSANNSTLQTAVDSAREALDQTFPHNAGPGTSLGSPESPISSLWRSITLGDNVEIFVLDLQYERNASQLMSSEQLSWFKNGLRASRAKFKVVMSSISFTDTTPLLVFVGNSWISAPEAQAQREEIIQWIVDQHIEGVLFVSGGSQFGMVAHAESTPDPKKAPEWSSWNITESVVGPVGTFINPQVKFNPRLAFASKQFLSIVDTFNTVVYNFDPVKGWVDITYLDDKCLVAYTDSFKLVSTPKKK